MKQESFDVDFFLSFFGAIHDERWCVNELENYSGRHCALGHCGARVTRGLLYEDSEASLALHDLFNEHFERGVAWINEGGASVVGSWDSGRRILAALNHIKQLQQEQAQEKNLPSGKQNALKVVSPVPASGSVSGAIAHRQSQSTEANACGGNPLNGVTAGKDPQSLSPVTSALAMQCVHLPMFGLCVYCGCAMPVKVEVEV